MKKKFVVSMLASFLLQSLVVYSVKASDDEESIPEVVVAKAVHEGYHGGSLVVRKRVDAWVESSTGTGGPSLDVGRLAGKLDKIGSDATTTLQDIEEVKADSKKLDDHLSAIPKTSSSVVIPHGFMGFSPDWAAGTLFLPKDRVDQFNHSRWALNLSPGSNAGSGYLGLVGHSDTTLADSLYINARHCGHNDNAYAGANWCCATYTRGIRYELISLVAFASRHSRTHREYVAEFERFERQVNMLDTQVRSYAAAHGYVVPPPVAYTSQRPVDRYRHIHGPAQTFSDWLKWLSPSSNTSAEILAFTDIDDPGVMSQKVYVQNRNANCGHNSSGYNYTGSNSCCGNQYHARSMRVDLFRVALDLITNQQYHDEYVRQATVFEDFARRTLSAYWTGWAGVPTSLIMATGGVGTVVTTPTGPVLTASEPSDAPYQTLKTDRERLRGGLTRAIATLRSAEECTEIAKGVWEIGKHCGDMTGIGFGVATLQQELANALKGTDELSLENKKLRKEVGEIREAERIRAREEEKARWQNSILEQKSQIERMELEAQKREEEFRLREERSEQKVQQMIKDQAIAMEAAAKIREEESRKMIGMTSLATTLGQILHELNMQKNPTDLYTFGTLTDDGITPFGPGRMDMVARAQILGKIQKVMMEKKSSFAAAFGDPA